MFGSLLILACALLLAYVLAHLAALPELARRIPRRIFLGAGVLLWAAFVLARLLGHGATARTVALIELLAMHGLATLFLLAICLLAIDLVTAFGRLWSRRVAAWRRAALVAGLLLSVIATIQGLRSPGITRYEVRLPALPKAADGTVLVALADLHLGTRLDGAWLAARLAQVAELNPDLVVLLGDILEGHGPPPAALLARLRQTAAPLGVWAVTGNHEYHGAGDAVAARLAEAGLQLLRDRWVQIRPGLLLAGVDDLTARRRRGEQGDLLGQALAGRPAGATVLLSHSPLLLDQAARAGVSLMLCGHTHGGQLWPFSYLVRTLYRFVDGLHEVRGMPVIVSRGTGTWGPLMRLWRRSEIVHVTLRALP